ncbi:MAG TPA: ATP-dependent helicase HrpB [Cyclobacteriaceae bacterium]|nr:ATP-dependent helicase HrpB [Cyclobacteriaceae bacterium]
MRYPILDVIPELKEKLSAHPTVILQAPPGAGKSTVLPLQLLTEPWLADKKIIILEPRRLAARSVAMRMASLHNEEAGETIGYRVRFENKVSARTRVEVVTEGILTRMIQTDNALEDIGLIIFDEFHERSLQADLALALAHQVQGLLRNDLRLLIMSATLDGEKISERLGRAPVLTSEGRQFPVTCIHVPPDKEAKLAVSVTQTVIKALREQKGDLLVFLPGAGEINRVEQQLNEANIHAMVTPLYGDLPFKKQQEAILPDAGGARKIVLATSIAETSLTIEGITAVIDSGYARVPRFDPRSGLTRLETIRVTKDAADQRAGRAGRLGPGVCYRMWSAATERMLQPSRQPEILEADLTTLVLELAQWGIQDVEQLNWITVPPAGTIRQATELLHALDALEENKITARGKEMLKLPTHPRLAHMLLVSEDKALATDVASILEERDPLPRESGSDLSLRVEALRKWRAGERVHAERSVLERIERLALAWRKVFKISADNTAPVDEEVGRLIMAAYPERIAHQQEKQGIRYKLANGRTAALPQHDALMREEWLAIADLDAGAKEGKIFLAAPVSKEYLLVQAHEQESVKWDSERGMITAQVESRWGNVVIASKPLQKIPDEQRIKILCEAVRGEGLKLLNWNDSHTQWQARVLSLRTWRENEPWPDVSEAALLETCEEWLAPFLNSANKRSDLQRLEVQPMLDAVLAWEQQQTLDKLAPGKLHVPSGSQISVRYFPDGAPPVMEVRLQEMFGLPETPVINEGNTKILLHLLSPGYKPVQVTQDLKSFWHTTYHEVRKELRMRYPKHAWPEDPWTAEAVRGVRKKKTG